VAASGFAELVAVRTANVVRVTTLGVTGLTRKRVTLTAENFRCPRASRQTCGASIKVEYPAHAVLTEIEQSKGFITKGKGVIIGRGSSMFQPLHQGL
jgi:hypothetical protein